MAKRGNPTSDLMTIGLYAPIVIAARMQMLATEMGRSTAKGRKEMALMTSEKSAAGAEFMFGMQRQMFADSAKFWLNPVAATAAFFGGAPALAATAALAPVRRRVRRNARRLTGL